MTKQKKSFFEKLTGIQKIEDQSEIEITDSSKNKEFSLLKEEAGYDVLKKDKGNDFFVKKQENDDLDQDFDDIEELEEDEEQEKEDIIAEELTKKPTKTSRKIIPESKDDSEIDEVGEEGQLTIDVYQTPKDIVIKSTIAGVKPEDLDVDINSEMVTIKGKRTQDDEADAEDYYYQECYWGPFSRSIILPVEIVTEKAEATMKNGILTIKLPKMEVAKTRKLQVRGF